MMMIEREEGVTTKRGPFPQFNQVAQESGSGNHLQFLTVV